MRRKLVIAAFLLLGSATLHAQDFALQVPATGTYTPRIYPANDAKNTYYMLDLRDMEQNIKRASGEKFKISSVSMNEFNDRKWSKDTNTQELLMADKSGAIMNVVVLLPANLTPITPWARTSVYSGTIPALPCVDAIPADRIELNYNLPSVPAVPSVPAKNQ